MGFAFIEKYDVDACAALCNGRGVDPNGGGCAYFNIWRAVVNGVPTTYTCSMVSYSLFSYSSSSLLPADPTLSTTSSPMNPPPSTSAKATSS
jgi:hypothetical protein